MSTLEVTDLSKRFGGLQAVNRISFQVRSGEVLGLIGPNGSGKSTTLALLMGLVRADSGSILLDGRQLKGLQTHAIAKRGMAMVFQHSRPLPRQTVLENIKLALLPDTLFQLFEKRDPTEQARQIAGKVGLAEVADLLPGALPFAGVRRLEIAKAIARDPKVLLLDEPFAGMAPAEIRELSRLVTTFREEGRAVILVDHNVKAVAGLVDRIVVMHVGAKIAEDVPDAIIADTKVRRIYFGKAIDTMLPTPVDQETPRPQSAREAPLLDVDIRSVTYGLAQALRDIRLQVRQGEFVAVVGINGAGKSTLFKSIMGFVPYTGRVDWRGQSLNGSRPANICARGIALCPESRELFGHMSVYENLEMGGHLLKRTELKAQMASVFELFPRLDERRRQAAYTLSGGEQQMLTVARALMQRPKLLIIDEPTMGLAPLVIQDIADAVEKLRSEAGLTVLLGEQNVTFALNHARKIYFLETGSLRWSGPAERFVKEMGNQVL